MKKKLLFIFSLFMVLMPNIVLAAPFKFCDLNENPEVIAGFRLGGIVLLIIKIVVPIILIILGMIDMSKAVLDSNQDAIKKSALTFGKRVIAAVLIFFVPVLIKSFFETIDGFDKIESEYKICIDCLLDISSCPSSAKIGNK